MKLARLLWTLGLLVAACQTETGPLTPDEDNGVPSGERAEGGGKADGARLRECLGTFRPAPPAGWRHFSSRLVSGLGSPVHSASDLIVRPGASATVNAKLAYGGALSKDLEDEWVWIFLDDCTSWRYLGYARTDDDGRARFTLPGTLPAGVYDVRLEVVGDGTVVPLRLWVLPTGTHLSVFDIDGTLTTSDSELYEEILTGAPPEAYPAAQDVALAEASRNEIVVYLTARPYILAGVTRSWLAQMGFPPGALQLAPSAGAAVPSSSGAGDYKAGFLNGLRAAGYRLDDAFGNATTDIYAYARAAIPLTRTWIIGANAGSGGTIPVSASWHAVAAKLYAEPPVSQPGF